MIQNRTVLFGTILGVIAIVDRVTKILALQVLNTAYPIIPGWLELHAVINRRLFYWNVRPSIVVPFLVVVMVVLCFVVLRELAQHHYRDVFFFLLFILGAESNVWDRMIYGGVIDFISIPFWSIFNIADIAIIIGILAWLLSSRASHKKNTEHL